MSFSEPLYCKVFLLFCPLLYLNKKKQEIRCSYLLLTLQDYFHPIPLLIIYTHFSDSNYVVSHHLKLTAVICKSEHYTPLVL